MYYVYVICSEEDEKYIGFTENIEQRIRQHNNGKTKSTHGRQWELVYYEAYAAKSDAVRRERKLKQDGRSRYQLMKRITKSLSK